MTKLLLIDGSSLAFRAFYGLNQLDKFKTKTGFHTNALYAFHTMLDAVMKREQPTHVLVAFDAGKTTFRTQMYAEYKGGRDKMPVELAEQWPYFKVMLDALGIAHYDLVDYEADDIIGTLSHQANQIGQEVVIVSGDKDMLQLVDKHVRVDILQKGAEVASHTLESIQETLQLTPHQIIDMKGLMGDSSDNYPGVTKVGEKTALKLIQEYGSIENLYEHVLEMKASKLKDNLISDKESAFLSKELATIHKQAPLAIAVSDTVYKGQQVALLKDFYVKMEFNQFLKQLDVTQTVESDEIIQQPFTLVTQPTSDMFQVGGALHIELLVDNYHTHVPIGAVWTQQDTVYVAKWEDIVNNVAFKQWLSDETKKKVIHDAKRLMIICQRFGLCLSGIALDTLLAAYLVDTNTTQQDIASTAHVYGLLHVSLDEDVYGKGAKFAVPEFDKVAQHLAQKGRVLLELQPQLEDQLQDRDLKDLYETIEQPLAVVLAQMEAEGVRVDKEQLVSMGQDLVGRIAELEQEIYALAGESFNISSPKQLGTILFEKLQLPASKKTKTGYSTAVDVLEKLAYVPIVENILLYRQLTKLNSTYVEGLQKFIGEDDKIHTRYVQALAQTGRLSSADPNLQNIPVRMEEGRKIRKAFVPSRPGWKMLAADYSQIELRVLAHIAKDEHMQQAFKDGEDIHTSTAMRVFGVDKSAVTSDMRRQAKAVNFGIVYGISDYGLSQNLNITRKEAQQFIDMYFEKYPRIKAYMEDIVAEAREKGYVTTLFQRRRYLEDIHSSNFNIRSFAERTAMNTPIQGSAADIIKVAMINMAQKIQEKQLQSKMLLQVHDELIFEVPEDEIDTMTKLVTEVMENAVSLDVPLKVDSQIGDSWYEAK